MASDGPAAAQFLLGLRVVDSDDEAPDPPAGIYTPGVPADEWAVDGLFNNQSGKDDHSTTPSEHCTPEKEPTHPF